MITVRLADLHFTRRADFAHIVLQVDKIGRVQLKEAHFVAVARERLCQPRRAAVKVVLRQYLFQTAYKFGQFGRPALSALFQERNALFVFADFLRFIAAQIIQTGTAVRIDIPIKLVFAVEIFEDEEKG